MSPQFDPITLGPIRSDRLLPAQLHRDPIMIWAWHEARYHEAQ